MRFLKNIVDFYIYSNIHVALAGYSLVKITLLKFGIIHSLTPVFVALSIIISYNFIRYYEIKKNLLNWFKSWFFENRMRLLILSIISALLIAYILFFKDFNLHSLIILFPFAFMTFFYVVPLLKIGKIEVSFRNFPSIKIFSISIAWAGISVLFPLYEAGYKFDSEVYIEFVQRVLLLIVFIIPFDIRDASVDPSSLRTLPQVLGIKKTKIVGVVLLFIVVLLEFYKIKYTQKDFLTLVVISIITLLFLGFSSPKRTRYYTGFWVESIPIIWLGIRMVL